MGPRQVFRTTERHTNAHFSTIELDVLTPAFYSRFVHYAHASEAFDREYLCTDDLNRTLWISRPELLPALLHKDKSDVFERARHQQRGETGLERLRWTLLRKLRCSPPTPSYRTERSINPSISKQDIRSIPHSGFDSYVRENPEDSSIYRRTVITLFVAERLAFGFEGIIHISDLSLRFVLLLLSYYYLNKIHKSARAATSDWHLGHMLFGAVELLLANMVHIWALVK